MDHLGQYIGGGHNYSIRCFTDRPEHTGSDETHVERFMQFPSRTESEWEFKDGTWYNPPLSRELTLNNRPEFGKEWKERLSAIIQRWLFFELLRAFFIDDPTFKPELFLRMEGAQYYVTTAKLNSFIDTWSNSIQQNSRNRTWRIIRAQEILVKARTIVATYCAARAEPPSDPIWPVDPLVALSLIILGETLTKALLKVEESKEIQQAGWRHNILAHQGWGHSSRVLQDIRTRWQIEDGGSCQKLDNLCTTFRGTTMGLLLAAADPPLYSNHGFCDASQCRAKQKSKTDRQVNKLVVSNFQLSSEEERGRNAEKAVQLLTDVARPTRPEPEHHVTCTDSSCKRHQVRGDDILNIIKGSKVPLFSLDRDTETLRVHDDCTLRDQFVVFSHAWLDGFGNDRERNFIFDCNLRFFDDICRRLLSTQRNAPAPKFWLDSLGIPEGKSDTERALAIRLIYRIYRSAKCTAVLDAGMMYGPRTDLTLQKAMRVTASNWISRIWTLQEAFLSSDLIFVFGADGEDLSNVSNIRDDLKDDSASHRYLSSDARVFYDRILREKRDRLPDAAETDSTRHVTPDFVAHVYQAVQFRGQDSERDETSALAILFNLSAFFDKDPDNLSGPYTVPEKRMRLLIECLCRLDHRQCPIPAGFVFLDVEKLPMDGFRWAPKTWLNGQERITPDPLRLTSPSTRLIPNHGLEVELPGMTLQAVSQDVDAIAEFGPLVIMSTSGVNEWYYVETTSDSLPTARMIRHRCLAIITMTSSVIQPKEVALLVAIDNPHGPSWYVEILAHIILRREHDPVGLAELASLLHKHKQGEDNQVAICPTTPFLCGQVVPSGQKWCIDGMRHDTREARDVSSRAHSRQIVGEPRGMAESRLGIAHPPTSDSRFQRIGTFINRNWRRARTNLSERYHPEQVGEATSQSF